MEKIVVRRRPILHYPTGDGGVTMSLKTSAAHKAIGAEALSFRMTWRKSAARITVRSLKSKIPMIAGKSNFTLLI